MIVVFKDEDVVGLRRTNFVVIGFLVLVLLRHLLAFRWRWIAAVVKTFVAFPRSIREFYPFDFVVQRFSRRDIEYVKLVPVGTALGDPVANVFSAFRDRQGAEPRSAIRRKFVRIKQYFR